MFVSIRQCVLMGCISLLITLAAFAQNAAPELNITLGEQRVRFAPTRGFQQMQLEVVNSVGEIVLTHLTTEGEYDWNLRSSSGEALAAGLYTYRLTLKFGDDTIRMHRGSVIIERDQQQVWLTAQDGAEVSGVALNVTRSGGRSVAGLRTAEDQSVKRDVSGREMADDKGNQLADKKPARQEKAALLATGNQLAKFAGDGVTLIDSNVTEVGGNVGIGTTTPGSILEMVRPGATDVVFRQANGIRAWSVGVSGSGDFWRIRDNTAGAARLVVSGTNGNVGIGTASPAWKLDVAGIAQIYASSGGSALRIRNRTSADVSQTVFYDEGGTYRGYLGYIGSAYSIAARANTVEFGSNGTDISFQPNTVEAMRMKQNGFVGIGTSNPLGQLHVRGSNPVRILGEVSTLSGGEFVDFMARSSSDLGGMRIQRNASTGDINTSILATAAGGSVSTKMIVYGDGKVAIGLTSPDARLEVHESNANTMAINGSAFGVNGIGVYGEANNGAGSVGVWGKSTVGYAGYFIGNVHVNGILSKAAGSFKIDHPLDPENKYLYHSFVESPDMMNIYNGVATLGEFGAAEITLPDWFEALNSDYRYQLTAIGMPGPNLFVAEEIKGNQFKIAGGSPGMKVSWQVTGIRQDAYARKHRIPVEEAKSEKERGTYLHPDAFDQPEEKGVNWEREAKFRAERQAATKKNEALRLNLADPSAKKQ